MDVEEEDVLRLAEMAECNVDQARFFLEASGGNFERAVAMFYGKPLQNTSQGSLLPFSNLSTRVFLINTPHPILTLNYRTENTQWLFKTTQCSEQYQHSSPTTSTRHPWRSSPPSPWWPFQTPWHCPHPPYNSIWYRNTCYWSCSRGSRCCSSCCSPSSNCQCSGWCRQSSVERASSSRPYCSCCLF
jgi:hypothetical protein